MNFSNVGKYKFDTKYDFGEIQEMYCSGYNWCHYEYTFLFQESGFGTYQNIYKGTDATQIEIPS